VSVTLGVMMQIAVSVQVADTIVARSPATMIVRATTPGNTAPVLSRPSATAAAVQLVSDVTRLGGGFGQAVATREMRYTVRASAPGSIVIAPVVATLGAQQATSAERTIVVRQPPSNAVPAIVTRAPLSRGTLVNFHALVTPDTVWAGEQVTLQVGVFIDDDLRGRLSRNPEYIAPSVDGAVAYDLPVANDDLPVRDVDGARYRPFVFARALFPLRTGVLLVPPARLAYSVGAAGTMFGGRQERQTVATTANRVVVRELPVAGRPSDFGGAVGVYGLSASLEKPTGRVGDAVQLTLRVEGVGNVKLLPAPTLAIPGVTASAPLEAIAVDSSDLLVRGSKTFRFLLTPTRDGTISLGALRYPYFNPARGVYEAATADAGTLRVGPGSTAIDVDVDVDVPDAALPIRRWQPVRQSDLAETWWFRGLLVVVLAPWMALGGRRVARILGVRGAAPRPPRQSRTGGAVDGVRADPAALRRSYLSALAPMVQLRPDEPFAVVDVVRRLRRAGVTPDAAEAAGALLRRLDLLTFGAGDGASAAMLDALASEAQAVQTQLSGELSVAGTRRLAAAAARLMVLITLPLAALLAQPPAFTTGVMAYQQQRFDVAAAAFAEAAAAEPRSADAWANLGAAHWMRADTAGAIVGWQRSARLAPWTSNARARLAQFAMESDPRLMIIPIDTAASWLVLLGVTTLLSVAGAVWRWRDRPLSNGALVGGAAVVGCCAILTMAAERSADGAGLVVVRHELALRTEPVLAGESGARARAGELARVIDSASSWRRITVSGGRTGWVETDAVRSLAIDDARDVARAEARVAGEAPVP